jgi:hypothetical protein
MKNSHIVLYIFSTIVITIFIYGFIKIGSNSKLKIKNTKAKAVNVFNYQLFMMLSSIMLIVVGLIQIHFAINI